VGYDCSKTYLYWESTEARNCSNLLLMRWCL
jgi:hypothetical protein